LFKCSIVHLFNCSKLRVQKVQKVMGTELVEVPGFNAARSIVQMFDCSFIQLFKTERLKGSKGTGTELAEISRLNKGFKQVGLKELICGAGSYWIAGFNSQPLCCENRKIALHFFII